MDNLQFKDIRTNILKLTQQGLAVELAFASNTIARMERGEIPIEKRTILALRWLVYDSSGITFIVKEREQKETTNTKPPPDTNQSDNIDFLQSELASKFDFSKDMIVEAVDKLSKVSNEFNFDEYNERALINFVLNEKASAFLNLRRLRGYAELC